jgi:hypothetical protein
MVRCTFRAYEPPIAVTCPKCKRSSTFVRGLCPRIDRCGFESHSFRCEWCSSYLAGVIDPSDEELVVSLLEQPTDVSSHPLKEKQ